MGNGTGLVAATEKETDEVFSPPECSKDELAIALVER